VDCLARGPFLFEVPAGMTSIRVAVEGRHQVMVEHSASVRDRGYLVWSDAEEDCSRSDTARSYFRVTASSPAGMVTGDDDDRYELTVATQDHFDLEVSGPGLYQLWLNSIMLEGASPNDEVGNDHVIITVYPGVDSPE
jgi:hypothetical protein